MGLLCNSAAFDVAAHILGMMVQVFVLEWHTHTHTHKRGCPACMHAHTRPASHMPAARCAPCRTLQARAPVGTIFYMAPEVLLLASYKGSALEAAVSKRVGERMDVWSLGVCLFELAAGARALLFCVCCTFAFLHDQTGSKWKGGSQGQVSAQVKRHCITNQADGILASVFCTPSQATSRSRVCPMRALQQQSSSMPWQTCHHT